MRLLVDYLIAQPDLDHPTVTTRDLIEPFELQLDRALRLAYRGSGDWRSHLLLQQSLYRINRLTLFWADDPTNYANERSCYLGRVRDRIETEWQRWEASQLPLETLQATPNVPDALRERTARDGSFKPTEQVRFFANMTRDGCRQLLAACSLDAQLEYRQLGRALGSLDPELHGSLARLVFEASADQPRLRAVSAYQTLLRFFRLATGPEAYFDSTPWEVLALTNLRFLLVEHKRHVPRLVGHLLYTTTTTPVSCIAFEQAAQELGVPAPIYAYWTERIKTDALQRRWLLEEVAIPLAERYPRHAWELLWGYDQQALATDRAAAALEGAVQAAQQTPAADFAPTVNLPNALAQQPEAVLLHQPPASTPLAS